MNRDSRLNASSVTLHPKELQTLFWDTTTTRQFLQKAAYAISLLLKKTASGAKSKWICCLEFVLFVLTLSRIELEESTRELETELSAKRYG